MIIINGDICLYIVEHFVHILYLLRPNKNNSWFQVSQPCFIWVGRSENHFIKKNILSQVCNKYKLFMSNCHT